eukprot:365818-Chlamydomonas_euryale.AAC.5
MDVWRRGAQQPQVLPLDGRGEARRGEARATTTPYLFSSLACINIFPNIHATSSTSTSGRARVVKGTDSKSVGFCRTGSNPVVRAFCLLASLLRSLSPVSIVALLHCRPARTAWQRAFRMARHRDLGSTPCPPPLPHIGSGRTIQPARPLSPLERNASRAKLARWCTKERLL